MAVTFSDAARQMLQAHPEGKIRQAVIREVLAQDPRPAYKKHRADDKLYAVNLYDWNVKFTVNAEAIVSTQLNPLTNHLADIISAQIRFRSPNHFQWQIDDK